MTADKPLTCACCAKETSRPPVGVHLFRKVHHEVAGQSYQGVGMFTAASVTTTYREEYLPAGFREFPVCQKCINAQIWEEIETWVSGAFMVAGYIIFYIFFRDAWSQLKPLLNLVLVFIILIGMAAVWELFWFSMMYFPDKADYEETAALKAVYPVLARELGRGNVAHPEAIAGTGQICLKTSRQARALRNAALRPKAVPVKHPLRWLLGSLAVQLTGVTLIVLWAKKIIVFPFFVNSFADPKGWWLLFVVLLGLGQVALLGLSVLLPLAGYYLAYEAFKGRGQSPSRGQGT
ncbi:MAG: hypothetical protein KC900_13935 [Candidatus Omnitrophica bacterium]|nr:hypothetical protein [Candidatus Omnitrophota bacterium]